MTINTSLNTLSQRITDVNTLEINDVATLTTNLNNQITKQSNDNTNINLRIHRNILLVYYITTMNTLERYFSDEYFLINKNDNTMIITDKSTNTICMELAIMPPYIKIELLNKCRNGLSGKKLLHIIREYAEERTDITHIELQDASLITNVCTNNSYRFSLADLYILSTGKSWYNSFGYKSKNYTNEISHNRKLLDMNIIDFIYLCNSKKYYPSSQEEMDEDIAGFYSFFDIFYNYNLKFLNHF